MNIYKSYLLYVVAAISHTCLATPSDAAAKTFIYSKLHSVKKYGMFLEGKAKEKTIYDIVFSLLQTKNSNADIFHNLLRTGNSFVYNGKDLLIQNYKDELIGQIIGFSDAAKNQFDMFNILLQGIIAMPNAEQTVQEQAFAEENWKPKGPSILNVSEQNLLWSQQEFIVELDFYLSEFSKNHNISRKASWKTFTTWLKELDSWWIQQEFDTWISKTFNMLTKKHMAVPATVFTRNNIIFFIETYLPKTFIMQNPKRTHINFENLKEVFPGFKIYETSKVYNIKHDPTTQREINFLINAINTNIQQLLHNDIYLGKVPPTASTQALQLKL